MGFLRGVSVMMLAHALGAACQLDSEQPLFAAVTSAFQRALQREGYAPGQVKGTPREVSELHIVSRRLDARLLVNSQAVSGEDFEVASASRHSVQLGVIVIRYRSQAEAREHSASLEKQGIFKNSKILTRFATAAVRNELVILFSENSGDAGVVRALRMAGQSLATAAEKR